MAQYEFSPHQVSRPLPNPEDLYEPWHFSNLASVQHFLFR